MKVLKIIFIVFVTFLLLFFIKRAQKDNFKGGYKYDLETDKPESSDDIDSSFHLSDEVLEDIKRIKEEEEAFFKKNIKKVGVKLKKY